MTNDAERRQKPAAGAAQTRPTPRMRDLLRKVCEGAVLRASEADDFFLVWPGNRYEYLDGNAAKTARALLRSGLLIRTNLGAYGPAAAAYDVLTTE